MGKALGRGGAALSLWRSRFFILAVITESALLIVSRILFVDNPNDRDVLWWTGIMTLNIAFFLFLAINAIRTENKFELYAFVFASLVLTGRTALDYWNGHEVFAIMIIVAVFQILYFILGYFVHDVMDQRFYEEVGTDIELKDITTSQMRFWSMCKIDLQMVVLLLFTALFYSGDSHYNAGLAVAAIMCVFELVWEYMGRNAVMHERNWLLNLFIVLGLVSPVWIIAFLVQFWDSPVFAGNEVFYKLIVTASIGFVIRVMLLIMTYACRQWFGKQFESRMVAARERAHNKRAAKMARINVPTHYVAIDG